MELVVEELNALEPKVKLKSVVIPDLAKTRMLVPAVLETEFK